jgi:hypothetical protein
MAAGLLGRLRRRGKPAGLAHPAGANHIPVAQDAIALRRLMRER